VWSRAPQGSQASAGALTALHGWLDALGVGGSSTNAVANGVVAGREVGGSQQLSAQKS